MKVSATTKLFLVSVAATVAAGLVLDYVRKRVQ